MATGTKTPAKDAKPAADEKAADEQAPAVVKRNMPKYDVQEVDELPEETPGGRARLYFDLLTKVAETPGKWHEVATFKTPTGANTAKRDLTKGEREIPAGEWEFRAIKVPNSENPAAPRHSKLYARLVG